MIVDELLGFLDRDPAPAELVECGLGDEQFGDRVGHERMSNARLGRIRLCREERVNPTNPRTTELQSSG